MFFDDNLINFLWFNLRNKIHMITYLARGEGYNSLRNIYNNIPSLMIFISFPFFWKICMFYVSFLILSLFVYNFIFFLIFILIIIFRGCLLKKTCTTNFFYLYRQWVRLVKGNMN